MCVIDHFGFQDDIISLKFKGNGELLMVLKQGNDMYNWYSTDGSLAGSGGLSE